MGVSMRRKGKAPEAWTSSSGTWGQKKPIGTRSLGREEGISRYPLEVIVSNSFRTLEREVSLFMNDQKFSKALILVLNLTQTNAYYNIRHLLLLIQMEEEESKCWKIKTHLLASG
jgi:hypothetical protein